VKIRQIEAALRYFWVDIEPQKGGIWLFLSRMIRRIPPKVWTIFEKYFLNQSQIEFLQLIRTVGGLHFAPIDLASVGAIHQFRKDSSSRFCIVVERDVNLYLVASLLNNLFEPCVLIEPFQSPQLAPSLNRDLRRLLGIQSCWVELGASAMMQIAKNIVNGRSVVISVSDFATDQVSKSSFAHHTTFLKLSRMSTGKLHDCVRFEPLNF
jgi:hypothetical protein